ncbi:MAG: bifunctional methylenetetrahydrofolate dehydrogenase/methenyltetrahydrofolate cyclohydrolase FolD [Acutalibacteraceae bacterium]|nr:bifunctional methylenetetrahydrofolate dehydrogenase/methenyltetrahydrofolate cyclohydrolase FolD [Oscillospiraceae bacterium]
MKIIDGKAVSLRIKDEIKEKTAKLSESGIIPTLAVIIVGNDPASRVYVNNKKKACEYVGFNSVEYALDESVSRNELLGLIDRLNADSGVDGILCQLPLPKHIDENAVMNAISYEKDVDAFNPINVGRIMSGDFGMLPCTPAGIMELIASTGESVCGKRAVVIGRSNIVGKPTAMLLLNADATVTVCHSKTKNLKDICRQADILIAAVGKAGFVTADMVKEGATVIDVGINRGKDGKLRGDVDFEGVAGKAGYITPVPGGCGPMTIAMLMKNTYNAALRRQNTETCG